MTESAATTDRLIGALGWASVALGLPSLVRPAAVARAVGVGDGARQTQLTAAVGARELAHAVGILVKPGAPWIWTRVAGDTLDIALLGFALARSDSRGRNRLIATTAAVAGIAALDVYAALRLRRTREGS